MSTPPQPPKSVTSFPLNTFGVICFFIALYLLRYFPELENDARISIAIAAAVIPILIGEIFVFKVHKNPTAKYGEVCRPKDNIRMTIKFLGLLGTFGVIIFFYWLLPEYRGNFYQTFYGYAMIVVPIMLVFSWPYFAYLDVRMEYPEDGYFHMGKVILLDFDNIDWKLLAEHFRGWTVKAFFLPLMFTYLLQDVNFIVFYDYNKMTNFIAFYDYMYVFIFTIDVVFACVGYMMTFRLIDTHIRSVEPTLLGWLVCVMCYSPFWSTLFYGSYFAYNDGFYWGHLTGNSPLLQMVWGLTILGTIIIYSAATVSLGYRFSNITYRGLVTNGPYRWTKHPAYISKNISWWLISIPFFPHVDAETSLRYCVLLLGVNLIYYWRARTEENHLSHYPEYVQYARWIEEHGVFCWVGRLFPYFKYDEERAKQGHPKILEPK